MTTSCSVSPPITPEAFAMPNVPARPRTATAATRPTKTGRRRRESRGSSSSSSSSAVGGSSSSGGRSTGGVPSAETAAAVRVPGISVVELTAAGVSSVESLGISPVPGTGSGASRPICSSMSAVAVSAGSVGSAASDVPPKSSCSSVIANRASPRAWRIAVALSGRSSGLGLVAHRTRASNWGLSPGTASDGAVTRSCTWR